MTGGDAEWKRARGSLWDKRGICHFVGGWRLDLKIAHKSSISAQKVGKKSGIVHVVLLNNVSQLF
jgi:hypothetical protein